MSVQEKLFGTAAVMAARNPLVPKGAVAAESDTGVVKIGDGATRYNLLPTALNGTYAGKTLKRSTLVVGDADGTAAVAAYDYCQRVWFMLPFGVTRYRLKIANRNSATMAAKTTPVTIKGIAVGTPALAATGRWTGAFTSTPTTVVSSDQSLPTDGTDYTSSWITTPSINAGTPVMVSIGWTSTNTGTGLTLAASMSDFASADGQHPLRGGYQAMGRLARVTT